MAQLYDSVGDADGVKTTMATVADYLGATASFWYVIARGVDRAAGEHPFGFQGFQGFTESGIRAFNDEMWRYDYALDHAVVVNRTTETHELISPQDAARSPYVAWMRASEGLDRRIARSTNLDDATVAGCAFHMPVGRTRCATERDRFDALAPHLRQMLRLSSLFGEHGAWREALEQVVAARAQAIVLLDADGTIRWASAAALALSAANDGLTCSGARLTFARNGDRQDFDRLLATSRAPKDFVDAVKAAFMMVARPSRKKAYGLEIAPAPVSFQRQFHARCAFIVTIRDPEQAIEGCPELWRSLFGLTPAEARVAQSSMRGLSDSAIAASLNVSIGTVRTHQQHILAKTETRSKAELAHLLTRLS